MEDNKYPTIFATPIGGMQYTVNVSQVFGDAYTFDEVIHVLHTAMPQDTVTFNINSDGGDLFSLIALKNAVKSSAAKIEMRLLGMAASAGSALLLEEAHGYYIGDDSCMMIHNMICSVGHDDTQKIVTRAEHNKKMNERFVRETYRFFLSDSEINDVINNSREIYLEDFEIRNRLTLREKLKAEEAERLHIESQNNLSEFTSEQLEEEVIACREDIKLYQKELKGRLKEKGGVSK